jgi:hypothetical protein
MRSAVQLSGACPFLSATSRAQVAAASFCAIAGTGMVTLLIYTVFTVCTALS